MRIVQGMFWWTVTVVTLVILDDLLFGPIFWGIAVVNPVASTITAFVASVVFQNWLIGAALKEHTGKVATFFLARLMLERKNREIARRETSVRRSAASAMGALIVTPLVGGVIPTLMLYKHDTMEIQRLRPFSIVLSVVYAGEFALLHGGYGLGGLLRVVSPF